MACVSGGVCLVFQLGDPALPLQTSCLLSSSLDQWFSTRPDFVPTSPPPPCTRATWPCLETFLIVTNGVLLLVSSGWRPVLLLTITQTSPAPQASRAKGETLCSRPWLLSRVSFPSCLAAKQKCSLCSLILFCLLFLKYPQSLFEVFLQALLSSQHAIDGIKITR